MVDGSRLAEGCFYSSQDIVVYPRHPGTEGTSVTWDFGHQWLRWDKSGHPEISETSRDRGDICGLGLWPLSGTSRDILGYLRHPGTEGTSVTWDFGHQCLRWDKSGHPELSETSWDRGDICGLGLWPLSGTSRDILGYLRHPGTEGTSVTWDFGHQCLRWDKSGHPGVSETSRDFGRHCLRWNKSGHLRIFINCTLHFLYVGQLGKSVAVLDIYQSRSDGCMPSLVGDCSQWLQVLTWCCIAVHKIFQQWLCVEQSCELFTDIRGSGGASNVCFHSLMSPSCIDKVWIYWNVHWIWCSPSSPFQE